MEIKTWLLMLILIGILLVGGCVESESPESYDATAESKNAKLGDFCSGEKECIDFCLANRGRCEGYCKGNENGLCKTIFPQESFVNQKTAINDCISNPKPIFTSSFTDITKIRSLSQIGSNALFNPGAQARSYITIRGGEVVPIYAPINSTVTMIAYSNKFYPDFVRPEYRLDMKASCEVTYSFDHIVSIVEKLQKQAPKTPANKSSEGIYVSIPIQAGELLGYTSGTVQAKTWDFVFINSAHNTFHINQDRWISDYSKHNDCPYDYFTDDLKDEYYSLIERPDNSKNTCGPFLRDVPGTISGYWFKDNSNENQGKRFGISNGKHFVEFILADERNFFSIRDGNPNRISPESVTIGENVCYFDSDNKKYVYLKLISEKEIMIVTGTGSCPSQFPGEGELYIR